MNVDHEIYNIVDKNDCIIGQATRRHIHQKKLLHRSAHILVFNSQKKLYLQKRALCKDESPGLWDTSSAGHVNAGETYDECAHRELFEELRIKAILLPFIKIPACEETHWEHIQVYSCTTDDLILINSEEISEGIFFDLPDIQKKISMNPTQFTPSFKLIFRLTLNDKNPFFVGVNH